MSRDIEETAKTAGEIFKFIGDAGVKFDDALKVLKERFETKKTKKTESRRWKPDQQEFYSFIDDAGNIGSSFWNDHRVDIWRWSQRNVFQAKEQAQAKLDQLQAYSELLDVIKEINEREDWEVDFGDDEQDKEYIGYYHGLEDLDYYSDAGDIQCGSCGSIEKYYKPGFYAEIVETLGKDKIKLALGING